MRCIVYPYSSENAVLLKYLNIQRNDIDLYRLVSPVSWGETGKIFSDSIIVTNDFEESLSEAEGLIVLNSSKTQYVYWDIVAKIKIALESNMVVYCCIKLNTDELNEINCIANKIGNFIYLANDRDIIYVPNDILIPQSSIVIALGGMLSNMNMSVLCCGLSKSYEELGYKVALLTPYDNCDLLSNHTKIPKSIFLSTCSETDKILAFNRFVNEVQDSSGADILLVCFTDGIMRYSDEYYGDFGVHSYEQAMALNIDCFFLSVVENYASNSTEQDVVELKNLCKYRFGCDLEAITVEDYNLDEENIDNQLNYVYTHVNPASVYKIIDKQNNDNKHIKFYPAFDENSFYQIAKNSIEQLSIQIDSF